MFLKSYNLDIEVSSISPLHSNVLHYSCLNIPGSVSEILWPRCGLCVTLTMYMLEMITLGAFRFHSAHVALKRNLTCTYEIPFDHKKNRRKPPLETSIMGNRKQGCQVESLQHRKNNGLYKHKCHYQILCSGLAIGPKLKICSGLCFHSDLKISLWVIPVPVELQWYFDTDKWA